MHNVIYLMLSRFAMAEPTEKQKTWLQQKGIRSYTMNGMTWFSANDCGRLLHLADPKGSMRKLPILEKSSLGDLIKHGLPNRLGWNKNDLKGTVISWTGLCQLVSKCRGQQSTWVAKRLGMEVIYKHLCHEAETIEAILKSFPGEVAELQYEIVTEAGNLYNIDLYFKEHNIVVECDEGGHAQYDPAKDQQRTTDIKETLDGCVFVRFNPDAADFDLFCVIGQIHQHMRASLLRK